VHFAFGALLLLYDLRLLPSRPARRQTRQGGVIRTGDGALSPAAALERYIERKYLSGGQNTLGDDTSAPAVSALILWPCPQAGCSATPCPRAQAYALSAAAGIFSMSGTVGSGRVPPTPLLRANSGGPPQASPRMGGESEPTTWSLQCYRSRGVLEDGAHLRLYFLQAGGGRGGSQWQLWAADDSSSPSHVCSAPSSSTPTQRPARRTSPSSPTRASWRAGRQSR